jgi:hypothetical protein
MTPALEKFVQQLHAQRIGDADDLETWLREIDEVADECEASFEFIDCAIWIAEQPVSVREKHRAICALAAVPDDVECDLILDGKRIEIELVPGVL